MSSEPAPTMRFLDAELHAITPWRGATSIVLGFMLSAIGLLVGAALGITLPASLIIPIMVVCSLASDAGISANRSPFAFAAVLGMTILAVTGIASLTASVS